MNPQRRRPRRRRHHCLLALRRCRGCWATEVASTAKGTEQVSIGTGRVGGGPAQARSRSRPQRGGQHHQKIAGVRAGTKRRQPSGREGAGEPAAASSPASGQAKEQRRKAAAGAKKGRRRPPRAGSGRSGAKRGSGSPPRTPTKSARREAGTGGRRLAAKAAASSRAASGFRGCRGAQQGGRGRQSAEVSATRKGRGGAEPVLRGNVSGRKFGVVIDPNQQHTPTVEAAAGPSAPPSHRDLREASHRDLEGMETVNGTPEQPLDQPRATCGQSHGPDDNSAAVSPTRQQGYSAPPVAKHRQWQPPQPRRSRRVQGREPTPLSGGMRKLGNTLVPGLHPTRRETKNWMDEHKRQWGALKFESRRPYPR